MTTLTRTKPWDFSLALALNSTPDTLPYDHESFKSPLVGSARGAVTNDYTNHVQKQDFALKASNALGDFGRVWQYLGVPVPSAGETSLEDRQAGGGKFPNKADYASDGATYNKIGGIKSATVAFADQDSAEEPTEGSTTDRSTSPETPKLTKSQRKKRNRKERKEQEAAAAALAAKTGVVSESEADTIFSNSKTPAVKASVHHVANEPTKPQTPKAVKPQTPKAAKPQVERAAITNDRGSLSDVPSSAKTPTAQTGSKVRVNPAYFKTNNTVTPLPKMLDHTMRHKSQPNGVSMADINQGPFISGVPQVPTTQPAARPVSTPFHTSSARFVPSSVQPQTHHHVANPVQAHFPSAQDAVAAVQSAMQNIPSKRPPPVIQPKVVRSGEDRHWALFLNILNVFPQERSHLVSPANMTTHNNDPNGIHIFVDASNIFIGFKDQLKRARNMHPLAQVPNVDLSFDGLALLMERRRPVAKRVLAGSNPHVAAFDKAKAVGYECSIMDRVYKAKELTARQIYFKERDAERRRGGKPDARAPPPPANSVMSPSKTVNGYQSGSGGSGSETTGQPQFTKPSYIEQGVDELLHLKICESIIDHSPSTMVIATGDAAQAEYSEGFMKMVERALKAGWKIELVSWSKNISQMYLRKEFTQTWGDKFRIIYLDDFAEDLLEM